MPGNAKHERKEPKASPPHPTPPPSSSSSTPAVAPDHLACVSYRDYRPEPGGWCAVGGGWGRWGGPTQITAFSGVWRAECCFRACLLQTEGSRPGEGGVPKERGHPNPPPPFRPSALECNISSRLLSRGPRGQTHAHARPGPISRRHVPSASGGGVLPSPRRRGGIRTRSRSWARSDVSFPSPSPPPPPFARVPPARSLPGSTRASLALHRRRRRRSAKAGPRLSPRER